MTDIFLYIPSIFSIYLILITGITSNYLRVTVQGYVKGKTFEKHGPLIIAVAEDWAERLGFVNSAISLFISMVVLSLNDTQNYVTVLLIVMVAAFTPMCFWVFTYPPSRLVTTKFPPPISITYATACRFVLIAMNLVVMAAIYLSQGIVGTTPTP
jgi:hypothetical protein